MSTLGSGIDLLVATMDLKLVQAITTAINANLPKDGPLGTIRPSSAQLYARPRQYYSQEREPRIEPRTVVHPNPTFATCCSTYDRFGLVCRADKSAGPVASDEGFVAWTMEGPDGSTAKSPIDAPWKHLPPVHESQAQIQVNVIRPKVDLVTKGMLIDFYA